MTDVGDLKPGDIVRLKKPHPCGGYHWHVNRVGGDIGLRCLDLRPLCYDTLGSAFSSASARLPGLS